MIMLFFFAGSDFLFCLGCGGVFVFQSQIQCSHVCFTYLHGHPTNFNFNHHSKKNKYGMTALHHAGLYGQTRTAKFLLRIGADKFLMDNDGRTAGKLAMDRYVDMLIS